MASSNDCGVWRGTLSLFATVLILAACQARPTPSTAIVPTNPPPLQSLPTATSTTVTIAAGGGVPFSSGDVFAGIGNGRWNHFDPAGNLLATLDDGQVESVGGFTPAHATTGVCFDPAGDMYATNLDANSMSKFSNDGKLLAESLGSFDAFPESCLIVSGNAMFVSEVGHTGDILKLDLAGSQLARYDVHRSDWIDLAADQCTMFYSDEGAAIHRLNVCTNKPLTDFVSGGGPFYALRILPDGTVLAASASAVRRFDSSGTQIASYTVAGFNRT